MRGLSAGATLDLWETAEPLGPVERALALAAAGEPGLGAEELAALPLGRRDARLLRLRGAGPLAAVASCPECAEPVELDVDADALLARERGSAPGPLALDGLELEWRPLDSSDVAAAAAAPDAESAERVLLRRCVTAARGPDGDVDAAALPAGARAALSRALADADPLAEILLDVECPSCGAAFVADVAPADFVWAELEAQAQRVLRDVDALARAYGWTEEEALALPPRRRAAYLRLARGETA